MHDVTDVNGCGARPTCCVSSATSASAVSLHSTSTATAAVGLDNFTSCIADSCNVSSAVPVTGGVSNSITVSAAISANVNQHSAAGVCNTVDSASVRSSASPTYALPSVTETTNSALLVYAREPTTTESPFCFSIAGYDFKKYTDMVISHVLLPLPLSLLLQLVFV